MERDSFVFYSSFLKAIRAIKKRDIQAELALAIIEYGITGETGECGEMVSMAMELIKPQIEANNQRYINGLKGAEHGVKGGRPRKEKPQENPTETPKKTQENPTETPNVNVNDNVNDLFQQTNKQAGAHERAAETKNQTLTAYEDFKGNSVMLTDWFVNRWKAAKKHYTTEPVGTVAIIGYAKMNLIEIAKTYTQHDIELAIKGVFIQKEIYPQFTLSPEKMLELDHFSKFYNAGLTKTQLYNESHQKGQRSSKNGVTRNIGDL